MKLFKAKIPQVGDLVSYEIGNIRRGVGFVINSKKNFLKIRWFGPDAYEQKASCSDLRLWYENYNFKIISAAAPKTSDFQNEEGQRL